MKETVSGCFFLNTVYNTIQYNIRLLVLDRTQANNMGTRYA